MALGHTHCLPFPKRWFVEMSKACCVCGEAKESKDNVLFNCKGHGCDVTVHQGIFLCDLARNVTFESYLF